MENKTNTNRAINLSARLNNLLIFRSACGGLLIFVILLSAWGGFQSIYAQDLWRVFTTQNSPLPTNFISRMVVDRNNVKWVGTALGMVKIEGNNWTIYDTTNTPLEDNGIFPLEVDKINNIWVSVAYQGIAKFDGVNWTIYDTINSGLPTIAIADIKIDEQNIKWITTNRGLAKFNDTTWVIFDTLNSGIPSNGLVPIEIDRHIKWVGSFDKGIGRYNDTTWINYNIYNSGLPGNFVWDIKIDYVGNAWIATHFSGLARFNYFLNQWTVYNTTNSGISSNYLFEVLTYEHRKWIGTQGSGLNFFNDTNWTTFTPANSPLPGYAVFNMSLDSNKNLWICCSGGLAIYNSNGIIGVNNNQKKMPNTFTLYQNFPNPFNPVTNIKYQITNNYTTVKLNVFDITGREIAALVNQKQNIGIYSVSFNGENLPSGVYFYRLIVSDASAPLSILYYETKKMVLLK